MEKSDDSLSSQENTLILNKAAFDAYLDKSQMLSYDEIINKIYSSFYLYNIEFIVDNWANVELELVKICKKYLHDFVLKNINLFAEVLKDKKIYNFLYIHNEVVKNSDFNLTLFPFLQETKDRYSWNKKDSLFIDINNQYIAIWFDKKFISELVEIEGNKRKYSVPICVFWDINHILIKKFFNEYSNSLVIWIDKWEIQNIIADFCNRILVSDSKKYFNLNQFKVEFPLLYLWKHINIKDTLNNVKGLDIPSNIKSVISYSLLSSLSINKVDDKEEKIYSLSISDNNYKDKFFLWWKIVDNYLWLAQFLSDISGDHDNITNANLPIFTSYYSYKIEVDTVWMENYIWINNEIWIIKYEDEKIRIDNEYYYIISIQPKVIVTKSDGNKYKLDKTWNSESKVDFSIVKTLKEFITKKWNYIRDNYDYKLIRENELNLWTILKTQAVKENDLFIIAVNNKNEYFIFNKKYLFWKWKNFYLLNQYKLLGLNFNIKTWDEISSGYITEFIENEKFDELFISLSSWNKSKIKKELKRILKKKATLKLEDNISKMILAKLDSKKYFFWWKWSELSDIVWLDFNKKNDIFSISLFHMKTYPFLQIHNSSFSKKSDHYWEYTEVLAQSMQKLKWFFDIKWDLLQDIKPLKANILEYYKAETTIWKKMSLIPDKCKNIIINIYFPIYLWDILDFDNINTIYKVKFADKINWSSIYLLTNLINSNISNISLTWVHIKWNLYWLLIDKDLRIKKIDFTQLLS